MSLCWALHPKGPVALSRSCSQLMRGFVRHQVAMSTDWMTATRTSWIKSQRYASDFEKVQSTNEDNHGRSSDWTSILNFPVTLKQACDSDRIHEEATLWFLKHFMTKSAAASLSSRLYLKDEMTSNELEDMLCSQKEVVHLLVEVSQPGTSLPRPGRRCRTSICSGIRHLAGTPNLIGRRPWESIEYIRNTQFRASPAKDRRNPFAIDWVLIGASIYQRQYMTWPNMSLYSGLFKKRLLNERLVVIVPDKTAVKIVVESTLGHTSIKWPVCQAQLEALQIVVRTCVWSRTCHAIGTLVHDLSKSDDND